MKDYIRDYIFGKKLKTATVVIHGGEPTANWNVVPSIMEQIDSLFKQNKNLLKLSSFKCRIYFNQLIFQQVQFYLEELKKFIFPRQATNLQKTEILSKDIVPFF